MIGGYRILDLKKLDYPINSVKQLGFNAYDFIVNTSKMILVENGAVVNGVYKTMLITSYYTLDDNLIVTLGVSVSNTFDIESTSGMLVKKDGTIEDYSA